MPKPRLQQLMSERQLWHARGAGVARRSTQHSVSSGFAALDQALHLGGWPVHGSTELLCSQSGIGELELVLPSLAERSRQRPVLWLNPPHLPFAPALEQHNQSCHQHYVLRCTTPREQLWAAEELLRSGAFSSLLSWFDGRPLQDRQLRRLHLAAREGNCWHLHFRDIRCQPQTSPAPLRLSLSASSQHLHVEVFKQSGGHAGQRLQLPRPTSLLWQQQPASSWPVYRQAPRRRLNLVASSRPEGALQRLPLGLDTLPRPGTPH